MILPLDTHDISDLDRVGAIIDRHGLAAVPVGLLETLAHDAKTLGVRPVAACVLLDENDPVVVRERAFAVLASGLIGARTRQTLPAGASS